jgi:hypothetical protein
MIIHNYACTINEPLVLFEKSKTEANLNALDYIPGSIFRGIIAGVCFAKPEQDDVIFDLIFNGSVKFGDAHLQIGDKRSRKIPASFYVEKGKEMKDRIYLFHNTTAEDWEKNLTQVRNGYFIGNESVIEISAVNNEECIKSARDEDTRSSKEGEMYMYRFLRAGQSFAFEIRSENKAYLEKIKKILHQKTKYIGKSKSAEFGGSVQITYKSEVNDSTNYQVADNKNTLVYAESNLCFINKFGDCTWEPTAEDLGITGTIDWEKSQIWHHRYTPFNTHRNTWDSERLIIKKGSVFFLTETTAIDNEKIKKGLGVFITEGFGRVLINPDFLLSKPKLNNTAEAPLPEETTQLPIIIHENETQLIQYLKVKAIQIQQEINIHKKIAEFKTNNTFNEISKSQWSKIANCSKEINTENELNLRLFDVNTGILMKGFKKPWTNANRAILARFIENQPESLRIRALQLFCKEMRNSKQNIS